MGEVGVASVAGASRRDEWRGLAAPLKTGQAGCGQGDQSVADLLRANGVPAGSVPVRRIARQRLVTGVAGPARERGPSHVVVPRIGLMFPRQLPFEAWVGVGAQLAAVAASSAWCLGDWLVYGQAAYGSRYREAIDRTGLDYQTLRNYAWVAGRFELPRRRDILSFGHHAEVAALPAPEQDFWLRKAEEFGWPTRRLRREVRASLTERGQGPPGLESADPASPERGEERQVVRVTLTPQQLELCEQAASTEGMTLHDWAARVLEQAALDLPPNRACS